MNTTATTTLVKATGRAKSTMVWLVGLVLRLGVVAGLTLVVAVAAARHSNGRGRLVPLLFPLVTMLGGATWAVHHRLPFFLSRTEVQRWLIAGVCSLLIVVVTVPAMYLAASLVFLFVDTTSWARLASPTNNGDEMRFYEYPGFID